jgi:hypothetical protein
MTIPIEELYSLRNTREFLLDLTDPQKTPRIQMRIRNQAKTLLRHYPSNIRLEEVWDPKVQEWNTSFLTQKH